MQATIAYAQVSGALEWFVNAYQEIAQWRASVERLFTFTDEIDSTCADLPLDHARVLRIPSAASFSFFLGRPPTSPAAATGFDLSWARRRCSNGRPRFSLAACQDPSNRGLSHSRAVLTERRDLMSEGRALEARIRVLEDIEAIKQLKAKYFRCLDNKHWDDLSDCFTENATTHYADGEYRLNGRDEIMTFLKAGLSLNAVKHFPDASG
jgi:hypothetical protein